MWRADLGVSISYTPTRSNISRRMWRAGLEVPSPSWSMHSIFISAPKTDALVCSRSLDQGIQVRFHCASNLQLKKSFTKKNIASFCLRTSFKECEERAPVWHRNRCSHRQRTSRSHIGCSKYASAALPNKIFLCVWSCCRCRRRRGFSHLGNERSTIASKIQS